MVLSRLIFVCVCILLTACNDGATGDQDTMSIADQSKQGITTDQIEDLRYIDYALSDITKRKVASWQQYQELNQHILELKQANFGFFKEEKAILKTLLDDSVTNVPEQLNTNAVVARLTALQTAIYRLHGEFEGNQINETQVLPAIQEVLIAFANLNFQMNKKFEKEGQNIQKE